MGRPALTRALEVRINGRLSGELSLPPFGRGQLHLSDRVAGLGAQIGDHVHAVLENLLPDSPDFRRRIAERTWARSDRPHDLLAAIGRDCIGAMQFLPPGTYPGDPFAIHGQTQSDAEIAATLRGIATTPLGLRPGDASRISKARWNGRPDGHGGRERRYDRLDHIQPRHFDETAEAAPAAIETVAARLPADFPARVAEPILTRARACAERLNPPV